jgi:hypothetical protein
MSTDRVNAAHPLVIRRRASVRRRQGRRAEVAAFEAWQRRQAAQPWPLPARRGRRG